MDRPAALRIENRRRFWSVLFPRWVAPVVAGVLAIELLISAVFLLDPTDPFGFLALFTQGIVIIGVLLAVKKSRRLAQVDAIEFSDRFRFYERGYPIAYDWNQLAGMWYEGVRNPARVAVTAVKPNVNEDRVLVVRLNRGAEVRLRVGPEQQAAVLAWAEFLQRLSTKSVRACAESAITG
jgi:hypothetical protein